MTRCKTAIDESIGQIFCIAVATLFLEWAMSDGHRLRCAQPKLRNYATHPYGALQTEIVGCMPQRSIFEEVPHQGGTHGQFGGLGGSEVCCETILVKYP